MNSCREFQNRPDIPEKRAAACWAYVPLMLSQNQFGFLKFRHLPDQVWDKYSRGDYHESEAGALEMHLLVCPVCQAQYEKTIRGTRPDAQGSNEHVH